MQSAQIYCQPEVNLKGLWVSAIEASFLWLQHQEEVTMSRSIVVLAPAESGEPQSSDRCKSNQAPAGSGLAAQSGASSAAAHVGGFRYSRCSVFPGQRLGFVLALCGRGSAYVQLERGRAGYRANISRTAGRGRGFN